MQCLRQQLEAGIGERIDGHHIARLKQRHRGDGQTVLRAIGHQHLRRLDVREPASFQILGHRRAIARAARMGLVVQQRFEIAFARQLTQRRSQQLRLARRCGVVEVQVGMAVGHGGVVHALAERQ